MKEKKEENGFRTQYLTSSEEIQVFKHLRGKGFQEIAEEIKNFRDLKADQQTSLLEGLSKKVKSQSDEIAANEKCLEEVKKSLESATTRRGVIEQEYRDARERRQNAIALGAEPEKLNASINDLKIEQEMLEDSVIGFERRIENLMSEGEILLREKRETEKMILRFRLIPLADEWNHLGEELSNVLKQIIILTEQLGEGFSRFRSGAQTIFPSSFEAFEHIGKLYLGDTVNDPENLGPNGRLKEIFNIGHFHYEVMEKRQRESEQLSKDVREKE